MEPSLHLDEIRKHNHSEIEKRRREKMNQLIRELAKLVPMCNAIPSTRKLDKLTVLRMTVQHIKAIKSSKALSDCINLTPSFISDDIIDRLLLQVRNARILELFRIFESWDTFWLGYQAMYPRFRSDLPNSV